jgi:hypothetical protein
MRWSSNIQGAPVAIFTEYLRDLVSYFFIATRCIGLTYLATISFRKILFYWCNSVQSVEKKMEELGTW